MIYITEKMIYVREDEDENGQILPVSVDRILAVSVVDSLNLLNEIRTVFLLYDPDSEPRRLVILMTDSELRTFRNWLDRLEFGSRHLLQRELFLSTRHGKRVPDALDDTEELEGFMFKHLLF